jgi:hypothetical protein
MCSVVLVKYIFESVYFVLNNPVESKIFLDKFKNIDTANIRVIKSRRIGRGM